MGPDAVQQAHSVRLRRAEHVMGTVVSFDVPGSVAAAVEDAVRWLHWVDATFSTFRADSDVSRLGRGSVSLARCAPEVASVLSACEAVSALSDGYFSVRSGGQLDPSGYVKGWAVERAAAMLTEAGSTSHSVNGGGDVQCVGARYGTGSGGSGGPGSGGPGSDGRWRIGIADPLRHGALACVVEGQDFAVATSGISERGTHILDPHTGLPPAGLVSVTVTGPRLTQADAYATAAFAMGFPLAREWAENLEGYTAFGINPDGTTWQTAGFPAAGAAER
jgi:FAD:protein FMN transferase